MTMPPKDIFKTCPLKLRRVIRRIGSIADANEMKAYVIGGIVRDLLLGCRNDDLDILVEGDARHLARQYSDEFNGRLKTYPQFGTATVILPDGMEVDFATCRAESYAYPGALPSVRVGNLRDDLLRRDFTINTFAAGINSDDWGRVIDLCDGETDLKKRLIRVLHAESFRDDPTRIFRAVRFEQRLGFRIEPQTLSLIGQALRSQDVYRVHPYRYFQELKKILQEKGAMKHVKRLCGLDALKVFGLDTALDMRLLANVEKGISLLADSAIAVGSGESGLLRLMAILDKASDVQVKEFAALVQLTKSQENSILQARMGLRLLPMLRKETLTAGSVHQALSPFSEVAVFYMFCAGKAAAPRQKILRFLMKDRYQRLIIKGDDLQKLGCEKTRIKMVLDKLLFLKIEGHLRTRRQEETRAKQLLKESRHHGQNGKGQ